jgi:sulfur carrier protein ThiS
MKVNVKLYGGYLETQVYKSKKGQMKISDKEINVSLKENATLLELLEILEISEYGGMMYQVNGKISHSSHKLNEGDTIEIFLLIDGG